MSLLILLQLATICNFVTATHELSTVSTEGVQPLMMGNIVLNTLHMSLNPFKGLEKTITFFKKLGLQERKE